MSSQAPKLVHGGTIASTILVTKEFADDMGEAALLKFMRPQLVMDIEKKAHEEYDPAYFRFKHREPYLKLIGNPRFEYPTYAIIMKSDVYIEKE